MTPIVVVVTDVGVVVGTDVGAVVVGIVVESGRRVVVGSVPTVPSLSVVERCSIVVGAAPGPGCGSREVSTATSATTSMAAARKPNCARFGRFMSTHSHPIRGARCEIQGGTTLFGADIVRRVAESGLGGLWLLTGVLSVGSGETTSSLI